MTRPDPTGATVSAGQGEQLLPCPFCGGEAEVIDLGNPNDDSYVHCTNRKCEVQQIARYTDAEAITAWNTRHRSADSELVEALELLAKFVSGTCPSCKGWGEVAYMGEMVACRCRGQYLPTPSHETIAKARDLIARHVLSRAGETK